MRTKITHRGWFGVCPIYIGDPYSMSPMLLERHPAMLPLFMFSELMYWLMFRALYWMNPDFEASWPVKITGELERPFWHKHGDEE